MSVTETETTTDASDENQDASGEADSGSGNSGDSGGTTSDADSFAAERERLTAQARQHQARADKAEQDRKDLEARLAALEAGKSDSSDSPKVPTLEEVQRAARSASLAATQLIAAQAPLKEEFPDADASIYGRLEEFDSVESLRAAVETSHLTVKKVRDEIRDEERKKVLAEVQEKHGLDLSLADPPTGDTSGDPTEAQLNAMSQVELDALEASNPGIIARVTGLDKLGSGDKAWGTH